MKTKRTKRASAKDLPQVLVVDIGGTSVKMLALGETKVRRFVSGPKMTPDKLVEAVTKRARGWRYTAITLGYPGLVSTSGPVTEPANLGPGWVGFDYAAAFGCPLRIVNDAAMQALGSYDGGRMLFLGFGTGVGSVLVIDRSIIPLELGELKWKGRTFYDHFGGRALAKIGEDRWRERVLEAIPSLQRAFLADYVVLGGGNSKFLCEPLPPNVRIGHNLTAFRGGYRLWGVDQSPTWQAEGSEDKGKSSGEWRFL